MQMDVISRTDEAGVCSKIAYLFDICPSISSSAESGVTAIAHSWNMSVKETCQLHPSLFPGKGTIFDI